MNRRLHPTHNQAVQYDEAASSRISMLRSCVKLQNCHIPAIRGAAVKEANERRQKTSFEIIFANNNKIKENNSFG